MCKIKFIGVSKNVKTGPISQTYSSCDTCPTSCKFKNNGCYAKMGHTLIHWKDTEVNGVAPSELREVINNTYSSNIIRHNVAGDIAIPNTSDIDEKLVDMLISAYKGKKAYTYTHCVVNDRNIAIVKKAISKSFVINFSCENIEQVKKCHANNVPCVLAVASMAKDKVKKEGITFIRCMANGKDITCSSCKKCLVKNRKSVVVFEVHGNGKYKALKANFLMEL